MIFADVRLAASNLRAQKIRTLLTALGIVFGVGSDLLSFVGGWLGDPDVAHAFRVQHPGDSATRRRGGEIRRKRRAHDLLKCELLFLGVDEAEIVCGREPQRCAEKRNDKKQLFQGGLLCGYQMRSGTSGRIILRSQP